MQLKVFCVFGGWYLWLLCRLGMLGLLDSASHYCVQASEDLLFQSWDSVKLFIDERQCDISCDWEIAMP